MKRLLLAIITVLGLSQLCLSQQVDIQLVENAPDYTRVELLPTAEWNSILSNVVFTLKWPVGQTVTLGTPTVNPAYTSMLPSGTLWVSGGFTYQVYAGFGFDAELITPDQPIVITIPKEGTYTPQIANDPFVQSSQVNGEFYVSIGGLNVTGDILLPTSVRELKTIAYQDGPTSIIFFSPLLNQLAIYRDGKYYDMVGQQLQINKTDELIRVSYHD